MERHLIGIIILILIISIFSTIIILPIITPSANTWAFNTTQINRLHTLGYTGKNVTIAIIDTGIDTTHQEFDSTTFTGWLDPINQEPTYYDDDDHGTHLAGILASQGSYEGIFTNILLTGISPDSSILAIKAIPQNQYLFGGGTDAPLIEAITYCITQNVDIILLSLGPSPESLHITNITTISNVIYTALSQGIFIILPSGNDGQSDDGDIIPLASIEHVISVGSIANTETISTYSSKGHQYPQMTDPNKKPEIVAPGESILSTRTAGAYGQQSGTGQAAAYVAGILALLLDAYPDFKKDGEKNQNLSTIILFKELLSETAKKIGSLQQSKNKLSHDDYYGYGLIQAYSLYEKLAKY
jgi:subtilisin family serine protease